jgi:RNA polymerase sigma factor (sigma-70 family)
VDNNNELEELIAQAKQGDPLAYEILVSRFRVSALVWARDIVRDAHLAEDVVQDAFIRMKNKLRDLQDNRKFGAWFKLMVRRLAINSIRGAARSSEIFTDLMPETDGNGSLDSIGNEQSVPEEWHEREAGDHLVRDSMLPLTDQARDILAASAYDEASPEELAIRFGMNKSNVYNILSRARIRANEERFRQQIAHHLNERRMHGHPAERLLQLPVYSRPYPFLSVMIGEALRAVGEEGFSHTGLMGVSGDAFRLNVATGCHWRGISTFDWSYTAYRTMERLGIAGACFGRPQRRAITPDQQVHILSVIQGSIDRGIPAVLRNLRINEFSFAYGYDDKLQLIRTLDSDRGERTYRYDQLGRTREDEPLFVLGLRERAAHPQSGEASLRSIVEHALGKEPPLEGFAFGLDGYRLWLEAVDNGSLDLQGHAYQVALLAEARQQAASYLEGLADNGIGQSMKRLLAAAADRYGRVSESFAKLYPSFPFGYGGSHGGQLARIRDGLREAWEAEREGVAILRQIIEPA